MLRRLARALILIPLALVVLFAIALLAVRLSANVPPGQGHAGTFRWRMDDPGFGGFSAIELDETGTQMTVISDKGAWTRGTIRREGGRIVAIDAEPVRPLLDHEGKPVKREFADSEGLAIGRDGVAYVSFELYSRVLRFPDFTKKSNRLPHHPEFLQYPLNSSLEALAIDDDGALYTIPEEPLTGDRFQVYRLRGKVWDKPFTLPQRGFYLVTGADIFEGRLYLLERAFYGVGFSTRVRSFDMDGGGERVLMNSRLGQFDNMEGIAVWRDGTDTVLTMISDDNFLPVVQRTEIVEYRIPD